MFHKDILLVDDSEPFCISIQELLEENGWRVDYTTNPETGLEILNVKEYRVVLLDLRMPNISGLDFLQILDQKKLVSRNYVIVLTGEITIENAVDSLRFGARDFVQKHAVVEYPDLFFERIEKSFEWQEQRISNEKLAEERRKAIEESRLIVKSVGHDMSGSYYASLMLRLQMLNNKIKKIQDEVQKAFSLCPANCQNRQHQEAISQIDNLINETVEKGQGIITLMGFFKELGAKLKDLGSAIDLEKTHKKSVDLNYLVKEALHLFMDSRIRENPEVTVNEEYSEIPLDILASSEDVVRVFVNLIENAYKAMDGKGTLTTRTYRNNDNAVVEISDTGCGIPPENLEKIWRPDYTNWQNKQGTGLGLMICKKAIENHDGTIDLSSEVGKGTTFTVKFKTI